jgi:hypothetical protein
MTLSAEQILALAPDPASAKAGSGQASRSKWSGLGSDDKAVWGLCQGSGKEPYKAQIELAGPAFKCTCPSRKFPCKHGLGLYLLYAAERTAFAEATVPAWVSDWLSAREQRGEQKAAKAAAEASLTPEDIAARAQAQQKRQEQRQGNVDAGLDVFDIWLADLARDGLAGLRSKPAKDWDAMAARLVDTQAAGLAGRLRRAGMLVYGSSAPAWEVEVGRELAQLALLSHSYRRLGQLPEPLQHDVRTAIGWVARQEDALATPGCADLWDVHGTQTEEDARVSRRACYLRGRRSGRWAVLQQFSAGAQALPPPLVPGTCYEGTLHYYPSAAPLRVVFGPDMQRVDLEPVAAGAPSVPEALLAAHAAALAANPFLDPQPMLLEQVVPQFAADRGWLLRADDGSALPLESRFRHPWHLHAIAGGAAVTVFGLWNGESLLPLAVTAGARLYPLDGAHIA